MLHRMTPLRLLWRHSLAYDTHIPTAQLRRHAAALHHRNDTAWRCTQQRQHIHSATKQRTPPTTLKLSANLRQLMKLIHPDLYTQHPAQQAVNGSNLSLLLALFSDIKSNKLDDAYPEQKHLTLQFYVRCDRVKPPSTSTQYDTLTQLRMNALNTAAGKNIADKLMKQHKRSSVKPFAIPGDVWSGWYITQPDKQFYLVGLTVSLNGGQCKKLVQKAVSVLFALTGLPTEFVWDSEYFVDKQHRMYTVNERSMYDEGEDDDVEHERLLRQQAEIDRRMGYA